MSTFDHVLLAPPDPILDLTRAFSSDPRTDKINLGVGLFKDAQLQTPILCSVKQAESLLFEEEMSKAYLPIEGEHSYLEATGALVLGLQLWAREKERISAFQAPGGTGALKIGATLIQEEAKAPVFISSPTWPNHKGVFLSAQLAVATYPYYDFKSHGIDFDLLCDFLRTLPPAAVIVLHACCHNPTGTDFTKEQWKTLSRCLKEKGHIPFFDCAYQGFGEGLEEDVWAVRYFVEAGHDMLIAISHSKNLSLYAERVGALLVVANSKKVSEAVSSRVKQMIRTIYSNPPLHGAKVAAKVLSLPSLRSLWESEVIAMRERLIEMRSLLASSLSLSHLLKGKGLFGFLGLDQAQVERLVKEYGIYMPSDGRINICGLTPHNITRVVDALSSL